MVLIFASEARDVNVSDSVLHLKGCADLALDAHYYVRGFSALKQIWAQRWRPGLSFQASVTRSPALHPCPNLMAKRTALPKGWG